MKIRFYFLTVYGEKCLGEVLVMEFKLTEIDKFVGVTRLLHKAYLEKTLISIVCMHIKSSLS
jgi:hypothetical protein